MSDTVKIAVAVSLLALLALYYMKTKQERMPSRSMTTTIPKVPTTMSDDSASLAPADINDVDFGPYADSVPPCTRMQPYV